MDSVEQSVDDTAPVELVTLAWITTVTEHHRHVLPLAELAEELRTTPEELREAIRHHARRGPWAELMTVTSELHDGAGERVDSLLAEVEDEPEHAEVDEDREGRVALGSLDAYDID